jgi:DNA-binding NtrC family response regulator
VLYVSTSSPGRTAVRERLQRATRSMTAADDLGEALSLLRTQAFALCVVDLSDDRSALAAVRVIRTQYPAMPVAGVIDPANPVVAGEAVHSGVVDLLPWPFDDRDVAALVANVRERVGLEPEAGESLRSGPVDTLLAHSPAMRLVLEQIREMGDSRAGVSLIGERGTGRGLIARTIHHIGASGDVSPFIEVDCATDSPAELEELLFGVGPERPVVNGRSGGAERVGRSGAIVGAHGGTLYLKNLVEAPARAQARLGRLLRDREGLLPDRRTVIDLDVRPMGSFEGGPESLVSDGRLRRDLMERLTPHRIDVPPLRRRHEDVPVLAVHFLRQACEQASVPAKTFSRSALSLLAALPWHGNAVELREVIGTLARSVRRSVIQLDDLLEHASLDGLTARIDDGVSLRDAKAQFERECISAVLRRHHGRVGEAAKALGIQRTNLYRKVRQLNVARSLLSTRK